MKAPFQLATTLQQPWLVVVAIPAGNPSWKHNSMGTSMQQQQPLLVPIWCLFTLQTKAHHAQVKAACRSQVSPRTYKAFPCTAFCWVGPVLTHLAGAQALSKQQPVLLPLVQQQLLPLQPQQIYRCLACLRASLLSQGPSKQLQGHLSHVPCLAGSSLL